MAKMKIIKQHDPEYIVYTDEHWDRLKGLRNQAVPLLKALAAYNATGAVFGSVARGDVTETSDLDIYVQEMIPTFTIDLALRIANFEIIGKEISMATPSSVIKALYYLGNEITISVRLTEYTSSQAQFYKFGGQIKLEDIINERRVPGVSKALLVIEPTEDGHKAYSLIWHEYEARELLGIDEKMIAERIRVLTKRDKFGRTGVFLKKMIDPEESFEESLKTMANTNSLIRRRMNFK